MIKIKLLCIGNKQTTYLEKYILSLKCSSHFKKIINVVKGLYILYICIFVFIYLYICLYILHVNQERHERIYIQLQRPGVYVKA